EDNFIGPLPQPNAPAAGWAEFWRDRRLEPQLRRARDAGHSPGPPADWERLFARLPGLLAPAERDGSSLLHGDLWSGNVVAGAGGEPWLVDPAAYRGHREVDLAMAGLFGGFSARFHAAYAEAWPLLPGYPEGRRAVYQLYYLLVHVVLFGGGYVERTRAALREALRAA
ncbi:MAG TPA: fructosamine kinase family protein, partial [Longimicrobiaceae bacterium]|nr:fructosamine kinase family protein [Longimicrobiaceae bacterium]